MPSELSGQTQPTIIADEILKGLRAIRDYHHLVSIHPHGGQSIHGKAFDLSDDFQHDLLLHWVEQEQKAGRNIYFHANVVRPAFKGTKAGKQDIYTCTHAQLDLDPVGNPDEPYEVRRERAKFTLKRIVRDHFPSVIIDSGNGFNILWKLDDRMTVAEYEPENQLMNAAFGMEGTFNADRILKVPGTIAYSNKTKLKKGYPEKRQAKLVQVNPGTTNFTELPKTPVPRSENSYGVPGIGGPITTGQGVSTSAGTPASSYKDLSIPLPTSVTQNEQDHLKKVIKATKELQQALRPDTGTADGSANLNWVAGACQRAGLDRLDYANIIFLSSKTAAHRHVMEQDHPERALGRAWAEADGVPAAEQFGKINDPRAVPPPKPKTSPEDYSVADITGDLENQGSLLGRIPAPKRAYVENFNLEGVRILLGQPKMGKSWLMMQEAQAIAECQPDFLGMRVHRARVLYCGFEDGKNRLHFRLKDLNTAPCDNIRYWHDPMPTAAENLAKMEAIYNVFPFEVMYVDTLKDWLGNAQARFGTAYDQSVEDIRPLMNFANAKGVSLTFTTHMKKDKRGVDDWMDLVQGSIGALARASTALMLDRKRGSDDAVLHRTGRDLMDEDDIALVWSGMPRAWELSPSSATAITARNHARAGSTKQQIMDALLRAGVPMLKDDLKLLTKGTARSRFYQALGDLRRAGIIGETDDTVFVL